jgi:CMP-N,N'-diacetyllegionaminic acid synthase
VKKKIHAIILARSGSKGIKNKNLLKINKKPLIYWSIKSCLISKKINNTWVSSDSDKILSIAKKYGAKTIKRPKKLSSDTSSSEDAWRHAINFIKKKNIIDIVVGVQPTSPIRSNYDFDNAIKKFFVKKNQSMFSASNFESFFSWSIGKKIKSNYNLNKRPIRQKLKKTILENGSFYIFSAKLFLKYKNRLFGNIGFYLMEKYKGFQIDNLEDLYLIKLLMKNKKYYEKP